MYANKQKIGKCISKWLENYMKPTENHENKCQIKTKNI